MPWIIAKYLITAGVIVVITELAKRSSKLGALVTALPLVAVPALIWVYVEKTTAKENRRLCHLHLLVRVTHALPMFLAPLQVRFGFRASMGIGVIMAIVCLLGLAHILKAFDTHLL